MCDGIIVPDNCTSPTNFVGTVTATLLGWNMFPTCDWLQGIVADNDVGVSKAAVAVCCRSSR